MLVYVLRRLALALVTLLLLSLIVFAIANVLPQNVGRAILGPFASVEAVAELNRQLGTDKPLVVQYLRLLRGIVTFDFGTSYQSGQPVRELIATTLANSSKLAILALSLTVPLGVVGGVFAALRRGRLADRVIVTLGLAGSAIPEFVTSTFMIFLLGLKLNVLPVLATWPEGSSLGTQLYYLLMPALSLVLVYFGYIARMARAGTITALEADYTRTATMKGLSKVAVLRRHVLRLIGIPIVTVFGLEFGSTLAFAVVTETIFSWPGIGKLIIDSISSLDRPVMVAYLMLVALVFIMINFLVDIAYAALDPRLRARRA